MADSPWPGGWLVEIVTGEVAETIHTYVTCIAS
jgi:hypothetical protein